jgi:hypothetical protein
MCFEFLTFLMCAYRSVVLPAQPVISVWVFIISLKNYYQQPFSKYSPLTAVWQGIL